MDTEKRIQPTYLDGLWELIGGVITIAFCVSIILGVFSIERTLVLLIAVAFGSIFGIVLISGGAIHLLRVYQFRKFSTETTGKVLDRKVVDVKGDWGPSGRHHSVIIVFNTFDREVTLEAGVNSKIYGFLQPGEEVRIIFLADDPRLALFEGEF